jgi:hypothetical protein
MDQVAGREFPGDFAKLSAVLHDVTRVQVHVTDWRAHEQTIAIVRDITNAASPSCV